MEEKGITLDSCYPRSSFLSGEEAKCSETCPSTNQTFPTTYKANFFSIENVESVKSHIVEEGPVIVLIEEFEDILHYKPKTTIKEKIKDKFIFDIDLGLRTFKVRKNKAKWEKKDKRKGGKKSEGSIGELNYGM